MIEVEYRRPVSDAQLLRTGASEMQVIDHSADQSSMNWCILVFQVVFLIIVTVKGIQLTSKCVCLFESRHYLRMSTETLQPSLVNRELKRVLGDRVQVCLGWPFHSSCRRRRANPSYSPPPSSSTTLQPRISLVSLVPCRANEIAKRQKKSTIQPAHIAQALEETEFASFLPSIEEYLNRSAVRVLGDS